MFNPMKRHVVAHPCLSRELAVLLLVCFALTVTVESVSPSSAVNLQAKFLGAKHHSPTQMKMPKLIYGTAWKENKTADLVQKALELGFQGIDTANQPVHYREDLVGLGIEQSQLKRSDIFLQTKFSAGQDMSKYSEELRPYDTKASVKEQVKQSFEKSLANLRTTYIDSLVLHSPLQTMTETMEAWNAMEDLFNQGKVKQLGISNIYKLSDLQTIFSKASVKPSVVQNHFAPDTCFDIALRKWCAANDIAYQSFWTLTANKPALNSSPVQAIAKSRNLTKEQAWLLFVMTDGIVLLDGTTNQEHMKQDLSLLKEALLSKEDHEGVWQWVREQSGCSA